MKPLLSLLLLSSCALRLSVSTSLYVHVVSPLYRDTRDVDLQDENTTNSTFNSTTTMPEPVLSPDNIANIIAAGSAVILLTCVLCILMYSFNHAEHKTRVKNALERNRQIDRQAAAAKARAERAKQQTEEKEDLDSSTTLTTTPDILNVNSPKAGNSGAQPSKNSANFSSQLAHNAVFDQDLFTGSSKGQHNSDTIRTDTIVDLEDESEGKQLVEYSGTASVVPVVATQSDLLVKVASSEIIVDLEDDETCTMNETLSSNSRDKIVGAEQTLVDISLSDDAVLGGLPDRNSDTSDRLNSNYPVLLVQSVDLHNNTGP